MGVKFTTTEGKDLYEFRANAITSSVNENIKNQKEKVLINLASQEYFKVIDKDKLEGKIVTPVLILLQNNHCGNSIRSICRKLQTNTISVILKSNGRAARIRQYPCPVYSIYILKR